MGGDELMACRGGAGSFGGIGAADGLGEDEEPGEVGAMVGGVRGGGALDDEEYQDGQPVQHRRFAV